MENRPQWGTRAGFIMAAVGSAIGLGNIWRFPGVAYENGGGAFFLPYLFALLTAGIPLLILEFTIGQKYRGSAPLSYSRMSKGAEWIGWWQVAIAFVISTYYAVIIAWAMSFAYFSFSNAWGDDPQTFLLVDYLQVGEAGAVGSLVPGVLIPLIIVWGVALGVLFAGVKRGIERANKIMIPTLVVLFLIIVIRAMTLPGALDGLNAFFQPNWEMITDGKVWVAAYGQIFFSLSIAFAIMITYSSYLPKKADITNNAFITGFANSSFELLAGFGVFAALGFMAAQQGVPISEVVSSGVILAFAVFPAIINEFPAFNEFFGFLFFTSLVLAGLTSLISITETYVAGIQEKFNVKRSTSVIVGGGIAAIISLLFATQGGLNFLDVVDYFVNQFGIAFAGLIEVVFIAWYIKQLDPLQKHANSVSDIRLGLWWKVCLGIITPVVLGYTMYDNLRQNLTAEYGDYPREFIFNFGWSVAIGVILLATLFSVKKWSGNSVQSSSNKKEVS
ncbi:sodium-dependent transporter [Jeotgalibacillus soli]|uniref:Transporter n=1 Tax=Jeotgalibacillus soli TaxID=889306 RepID=A0A0C2VDK3_9BACL|nr:sodium-dependent transporter [Jeotgalibacillus soli]KIL42641.1 transporter [Jeotgalibacillus soli]